jgi:probable HAF family extracellular repeat protein
MKTLHSIGISMALALAVTTAKAQTPKYNLTDIGALLGTNSAAQAINGPGTVVGYWVKDSGAAAFLYQSNQVYEVTALGTNANYALSINDSGHVVGSSLTPDGFRAFYFDGTVYNLGDWGGTNSHATWINDSNGIVGFAESTNGATAVFFNGQPWSLGDLGGGSAYAYGVNASNFVVGTSTTAGGDAHAFLYGASGMQDLNGLVAGGGFTLVAAQAINQAGSVVGWGTTNGQVRPFFFDGTNLTIIGLPSGATNGYGYAINAAGAVVGSCGGTNGPLALLWQNGNPYDLNACISASSGWALREAAGINDSGSIVGWGNTNGEVHAFLLTPNQPPSVSITSPTNGASMSSPVDLTITASAFDDVGIARVDIYSGNRLLGSSTTAPYTVTWPDVCAGTYSFTAVAYDNLGTVSTSAVVTVSVTLPHSASLKCWLRPESLTMANGAAITNWSDYSGKGNAGTMSPSAVAPTCATNLINGFPAAKFNGTSQGLGFPNFMNGASQAEAFMVMKPLRSSSNPPWQFSGSSQSSDFNNNPSFGIYDTFGLAGTDRNWAGYSSFIPSFFAYNVHCGAGQWVAQVNGYPQTSKSVSGVSFAYPLSLGRSWNGYSYSYGSNYISELLVYIAQLTTAERVSVNKYLVSKYQLGMPTTPPSVPILGTYALSCTNVELTWTWQHATNWTGAKIERKSPGENYVEIARVQNTASFTDSASVADTVAPGQSYTYRIKVYNFYGDADYSNESTVTTPLSSTFPIGNLAVWLRADAGFAEKRSTLWLDQSGKGNDFNVYGNPVQLSANGQTAIDFSASYTYAMLSHDVVGATGTEAFFALKIPTMTGGARSLNWIDGNGTAAIYPSSATTVTDPFCSTSTHIVTVPDLRSWHVYNPHSQAGDWAANINGLLRYQTAANTYNHGASSTTISDYYNSFGGDISEVMIFNRVLTVAEREEVNRYFNSKLHFCTNSPGQITNFHCNALSPGKLQLTWKAVTNATSYLLEKSINSAAYTAIGVLAQTATNYVDNVQSDAEFTYRLSAQNYFGTNSIVLQTPLATITAPSATDPSLTSQSVSIVAQPSGVMATNFNPVINSGFVTGGNGYITVTNSSCVFFTNRLPFTIECRISPKSYPSIRSGLVSKFNQGGANDWLLCIDTNGTPFVSRGGTRSQAASALPTNTWTHVAGAYDGTNLMIYVNGSRVASVVDTTSATGTPTLPVMIGGSHSNSLPTLLVNATFDEVRIWNTNVPAATISNWQAQVLTTNHPCYRSLVSYLPLDGQAPNITVTNGSFAPVGYNPFHIDLLVNGHFQQRWTNAPYQTTLVACAPQHWNMMALADDGFGNSRYSTIIGADTTSSTDTDGDGVLDYFDAYPTNTSLWLSSFSDAGILQPPAVGSCIATSPQTNVLSWGPVVGALGYKIENVVAGVANLVGTTDTNQFTFTDASAPASGDLIYFISATNACTQAPFRIAPPAITFIVPTNGQSFSSSRTTSLQAIASSASVVTQMLAQVASGTITNQGTNITGTVTINPGANTLTAGAWDQAGNSRYITCTIYGDIPSAPSSLSASGISCTTNVVSWQSVTNADGYTVARITQSGINLVASLGNPSRSQSIQMTFTDSGAPIAGPLTYQVAATNAITQATVSVSVPEVQLVGPSDLQETNFTITANADTNVVQVQLYASGSLMGTLSAAPFAFTFPATSQEQLVFYATAFDALGNSRISPSVNVFISNTADWATDVITNGISPDSTSTHLQIYRPN